MQSNTLCIDWGNSLVKIAIIDHTDRIIEKYTVSADETASKLQNEIIPQNKVSGAIVCSVTNKHQEIMPLLQEHIANVILLDHTTRLPIMNAYSSPETLGADRIAMATAAYMLYPDKNNLVTSVGTCITYNFIGKNRAFRGGAISPGLQMRLRAMNEYTAKLPKISLNNDWTLIGYDTESGMRSGAMYGILTEIDGIIETYAAQYADFNAILTGGDAAIFASKLKNKIFADPDILMKGLNQILKYNVPQPR